MQNDELTDEEFAAKWPENAEYARYSVLVEIYRVARDRAMAEREKAKAQPQQDAGEFWVAGKFEPNTHGCYVYRESNGSVLRFDDEEGASVGGGRMDRIGKATSKAEAQTLVEADIALRKAVRIMQGVPPVADALTEALDALKQPPGQVEAQASAHPTPYVERLDRMVCAIVSSGCFLESPEEEITQLAAVFLAENDTFIELTKSEPAEL